jgi:hypothetical protein
MKMRTVSGTGRCNCGNEPGMVHGWLHEEAQGAGDRQGNADEAMMSSSLR